MKSFAYTRNLALGASAIALVGAMPASVYAQATAGAAGDAAATAAPESAEPEIVVTGFRASLQTSIGVKRNSDIIVESVSTEDLGRLPDTSIADAISRLPGIASQRTGGQSSAINIRGLSQNLTFSTLNGREQVSPNGARTVEFDQYPSELLGGADVYKSPKASLIEGGIGGTVELKTIRPLDKKERSFLINARGQFNDRAKGNYDTGSFGYRVNISYIDQFADDTIGIALGYSRLDQPQVSNRFVGFDYAQATTDLSGDGVPDATSFGFEAEQEGGRNRRDGAFGTLQWKPSDRFEWTTDLFYSRFSTQSFGRGIRVTGPQGLNSTPQTTIVSNPVFADNALIGGNLIRNVTPPTIGCCNFGLTTISFADNQDDNNRLFTVGSKAAYKGDRLTASLDFTYSTAKSTFANQVGAIARLSSLTAGGFGFGGPSTGLPVIEANQNVGFLLRGTELPTLAFGQDYTDRSVSYLTRLGLFPYENNDRLYAIAGNAKYLAELGPLDSIEFGVRYSDRRASQRRESADYGNDAGYFQFAQRPLTPIALTAQNSQVQCFSGKFAAAGFPCFLTVADPAALVSAQVGALTTDQSQGFTRSESFTVSEKVIAGFAQANIKTVVFGLPLSGNVGLRVVGTKQSSVNQALPTFTRERSFVDWLPSFNANLALSPKDSLRFAASRALSRAPLTELGGGVGISFNTSENRLTSNSNGNPLLRPFLANQGDISYEHYFSSNGIVSVAVFYKALESFIVNQSVNDYEFADSGLIPLLSVSDAAIFNAAQAGPTPPGTIGRFNGPVNGQGGRVYGLEISGTYTFDFLPGALSGLGVNASYSLTRSQISITNSLGGSPRALSLPGLSDNVFNGSVFYELGGFATRASVRYRSPFVSPQTGINSQLPFTSSEVVVDYQASYKFPETSALNGFTLLFQANNLTDQPVRTYFGQQAQTGTLQYFGREFFLGASFAF
jgi:iron complex outermembrane recepter protein